MSKQVLIGSSLALLSISSYIYYKRNYKMSELSDYQKSLQLIINFGALQNPSSDDWKSLPLPTPNDLKSFGTRINTDKLLKNVISNGHTVIQRPEKKLERIQQKADPSKLPKVHPYFKIHSDLTGFKTFCSFEDIEKVTELIINDFKENNKNLSYQIERNIFDPSSKDIIQRIYFYDNTVSGSVIEYLVGHPFALEVFRMNSYDRDNIDKKYPKFFKGTPSIYDEIKSLILAGKPVVETLKTKGLYDHFDKEVLTEKY